jgi:hypothetical protein
LPLRKIPEPAAANLRRRKKKKKRKKKEGHSATPKETVKGAAPDNQVEGFETKKRKTAGKRPERS